MRKEGIFLSNIMQQINKDGTANSTGTGGWTKEDQEMFDDDYEVVRCICDKYIYHENAHFSYVSLSLFDRMVD